MPNGHTETPQSYLERMCRNLAAKVWNEALDRAIEQIHQADNYRDASCRVADMKVDRE